MRVKRGPERYKIIGVGIFSSFVGMLGFILDVGAVPLNVINIEALEGVPRMRADYGFYAADNQSSFKGDSYLDLMVSNVKPRSTNALQRSGCRYKATIYASGDNVPTEESCLFCHCKGSIVVCKLRVCPEVPDPPPPGCIVVQKANKCCSQLVCYDNQIRKLAREQRLSESNATETLPSSALQSLERANSCVHEGTVYAEGSAMRSSTLCEHCFCIHGKMKCSSPQCLIPMNGCKPRYRSYACCPTNYDCNKSNQTAILKTIPSSTQVPNFLKGCTVGGRYVPEGDPILPMQLAIEHYNNSLGPGSSSRCQTCFCMGGVVHCRRLACDRPIEGCRPIIEDGHCCPDRYECEKPVITKEDEDTSDETSTDIVRDEVETTIATTSYPETTSTQVYEIRFEKVPLFKARKDDQDSVDVTTTGNNAGPYMNNKEPRITYNSVGGFKNRGSAVGDRGSREQRRKNKERNEFLPRSFYDDDAREDTSLSFEGSNGRSDEHASVFFEEKSDGSTSADDEELPTSETDPSVIVTEISEIKTDLPSPNDTLDTSTLTFTEADIIPKNVEPTATELSNDQINMKLVLEDDEAEAEDIVPLTLTNDLKLEPEIKTTLKPELIVSSASPPPEFSSSSTVTPTPTPKSSTTPASSSTTPIPITSTSETNSGKLEFISFGMEDAFSPVNETRYEIYPGQAVSLPMPTYNLAARQGSLLPADPQQHKEIPTPNKTQSTGVNNNTSRPISLAEPSTQDDLRNTIMDVPVQTSLYNNGYYGQGAIGDDSGKDIELVITQAEMSNKPVEEGVNSGENIGLGEAIPSHNAIITTTMPSIPVTSTTTTKPKPHKSQVSSSSSKRPEQPLTVISSNQKFIPSFLPMTTSPPNPGRTYSKFGIQDSSHRYGYPSTGPAAQTGPEDEDRLFVPSSAFGFPADPNLMNRKVPSFNEDPVNRRFNSNNNNNNNHAFNHHRFPVDPILTEEGEDDDEETNDNGSEEFGSYENYFTPQTAPSSVASIRPLNGPPYNPSTSSFSNRYGTPSGSNSSPPHSSVPQQEPSAPIPMISSSGTKVSLSSRDKTTQGPGGPKTKFVNSKPLRRPKPVKDPQLLDSSDPLGFKPVVAFPFAIPQSQDKFNLGLKLSGCNIYGKMHGIGQIIHELSSICVQCKCTEVGVQCSELQC
ncbi:mucin-17 isoform X2 [Folsomia candida]|uniref:mucin-17 isoform X2 n=1 Tax=Folsomia candida TaxID=158441 RepID=UPI001604DF32|nr:mucin-17 isoform X2 [Folsomia candida]